MGVWWTSVFTPHGQKWGISYFTPAKGWTTIFAHCWKLHQMMPWRWEVTDLAKIGSRFFLNDGQLSLWLRFDNLYMNYGQFLLWFVQGQWLFGNEFYRRTMTRNNQVFDPAHLESCCVSPLVASRYLTRKHTQPTYNGTFSSEIMDGYDDTLHFFESLKHLHITLQEEHPQIARWLSPGGKWVCP